jgi:hypothetical protein
MFSRLCSFGGYGAAISYSESTSTDSSHSDKSDVTYSVTGSADADFTLLMFSIGPHLKFKVTSTHGSSNSSSVQKNKSVSRTRGFSLSDGDEYDVFDVQVYRWARDCC